MLKSILFYFSFAASLLNS